MAKFKYAPAMADGQALSSYFEGDLVLDEQHTSKEARWVDDISMNSFTIEGKGFKFENGLLVSGNIEKITFEDFEGSDFLVVTGELNAKQIGKAIDASMLLLQNVINNGDDKLVGTDNDDYLDGGKRNDRIFGGDGADTIMGNGGKDIVTGGAGADVFLFEGPYSFGSSDGHDIITDFDASGPDQDKLHLSAGGITDIYRDGKNTVIEIEEDYSITLLNVRPKDISVDDFVA